MERSRIVTFAALALIGGSLSAMPARAPLRFRRLNNGSARRRPSRRLVAPETRVRRKRLTPQLHHQPTPGSVHSAERMANADGEAALARARNADAAGDASACTKALMEAQAIYGIE